METNKFSNSIDLKSMTLMSLLQFGGQTLLKEAISQEIDEYLGRQRYERLKPGQEFKGERNGYQRTSLDTPIGPVEFDRPKVAYAKDFESQFHKKHMRRPEEFAASIADMYVNGVSTRKVKDSLKAVAGDKVKLSKATVSRVTKKLRDEFKIWKTRDLSSLDIAYLFFDGIRVGMRMGGTTKDSVFLAYAVLKNGNCELLSIDLGQSESDKGWGKFISDLKARGLSNPLLVISDGNQGLINSLESHFSNSYRQRCLKHKSENILDAVPKDEQDEVYKKLAKIFYGATSLEQAKLFIKDFKKEFGNKFPTAVERLEKDLDQCLTFYLFPANHWKRIRTSNKLERLNRELRRRLDVIGRHPDELGCLALIHQVAKKYSNLRLEFKTNELVLKLWQRLRNDKISMIEQLALDLYQVTA